MTSTHPLRVAATVTNTGSVAGKDVPQLYVTGVPGRQQQRLLGWDKVALKTGESRRVTLEVDDRLLADFDPSSQQWRLQAAPIAWRWGIRPRT